MISRFKRLLHNWLYPLGTRQLPPLPLPQCTSLFYGPRDVMPGNYRCELEQHNEGPHKAHTVAGNLITW